MFFHNFFYNIQSQPAAFVGLFCGKEPLQDSRQNLRVNSLATIRDGQEQDGFSSIAPTVKTLQLSLA
jgi:hypothetical protein